MDILFVGLNYAPEPVGIAVYTTGLAEALAARGHSVTAIAGRPYYPQWQPYPGSHRGWSTRIENGVKVMRCPHYIPAVPSGSRRLIHHASFAAAALPIALRAAAKRPDVVIAVAPSLISVPVAAMAARVAGAKLWLHVQDFEVEAAFATGLLRGGSRFADSATAVERRLLGLADRVSTISPQMIARLADKGVPAERQVELRNWADDSIAFPEAAAPNRYAQEWGLEGRKVALYSGNIANKQGLEIVIEAAHRLRGRDDIAFVICGNGPSRARLEALAGDAPNVRFADLQPRARMGELLALATVHLLPQIAGAADLVLPSKLANMLASARPVVACADPGTGLAAEVDGCGLVVPPGNAAAMAAAVERLAGDPALCDRLGAAGRERAQQRWSRVAIVAGFERRLGELVGAA